MSNISKAHSLPISYFFNVQVYHPYRTTLYFIRQCFKKIQSISILKIFKENKISKYPDNWLFVERNPLKLNYLTNDLDKIDRKYELA